MTKNEKTIKLLSNPFNSMGMPPSFDKDIINIHLSAHNILRKACIENNPELMNYQVGSRFMYRCDYTYKKLFFWKKKDNYEDMFPIMKIIKEDENYIVAETTSCESGLGLVIPIKKAFEKKNIIKNYGKIIMRWDIEKMLSDRLKKDIKLEGWDDGKIVYHQDTKVLINALNLYFLTKFKNV